MLLGAMSTMVTSSRTCTIFLSIGINLIQRRSVATAFILSNPSSFLERKKTDDRFSTGNERVSNSRLLSSVDDYGRRVRKSTSDWDEDNYSGDAKQSSSEKSDSDQGINGRQDDSWDDFDPWQAPQESRGPQRRNNNQNTDDKYYNNNDDWNSFDDRSSGRQQQRRQSGRGRGRGSRGGGNFQQGSRTSNQNSRHASRTYNNNSNRPDNNFPTKNRFKQGRNEDDGSSSTSRSINLKTLEEAGFVHLYGLSSVLNALATGRRDLETNLEKSKSELDDFNTVDDGDDDDFQEFNRPSPVPKHDVKPQAQFRPYLFVQERRFDSGSDRRSSKSSTAQQVMALAKERNVPISYVDKGVLNVLSGNRPHQGFALRAGKLFFDSLSRIPMPNNSDTVDESTTTTPGLWLVLDEVVDPQNLGALLRSAYFLGGKNKIGVLVCSKNSAPLSATVSASSAGALEIIPVHSTTNLPRTLNQAKQDGFRIIGASSSVPSSSSSSFSKIDRNRIGEEIIEDSIPPPLYDLQDVPARHQDGDDRPILLVMGSEGHGLRTLVSKACTEFVRIPSGIEGGMDEQEPNIIDGNGNNNAGVESLNVSVSGGIILWQLIRGGS